MRKSELSRYKKVQRIAKEAARYLGSFIQTGKSESDIALAAKGFMNSKGVKSFWYHDVAALVLVGRRTTESVSGRTYRPTTKKVKENDLVTVDLSPEMGSYWGDHARSYVIENGKAVERKSTGSTEKTDEFFDGIAAEMALHDRLIEAARPDLTFDELYSEMNGLIEDSGYVNLDFKKNLGHSIEKKKGDRAYLEKSCDRKLGEVDLFTFEPHIKRKHGWYGYKWEDIYYFSDGRLKRL